MRLVSNKSQQRGFTLLEAMIALVVLSVGMLGIAALYVEGLKAGRTAVFRTTAVTLAADMMDRVRANPAARGGYAATGKSNTCLNGSSACTSAQIAQEDVFIWQAEIADRMPAGASGSVGVALGTPFDTYTVTVSWPEAGYSSNLTYTLVAQL